MTLHLSHFMSAVYKLNSSVPTMTAHLKRAWTYILLTELRFIQAHGRTLKQAQNCPREQGKENRLDFY